MVRTIGSALAVFYTRGTRLERRCYQVAALLFLSGMLHLGVQAVLGGPWEGPVSWRKPATFGLSFGLTLATATWVTTFVAIGTRTRSRLLAAFAAACVVEVLVISIQAWRRVPSHFNISTPTNAAFAYTAAAGGAVIIGTSIAFALASSRPNPALTAPLQLSVRVGFATFLVALGIGAAMIAVGTAEARTGSQSAAYTAATHLKPGHAVTMHGILVLPFIAWLGTLTTWSPARELRTVALACGGYVLAAGVVVIDTLVAVNPWRPLSAPVVTTSLLVVGMLAVVSAGLLTLRGLRAAGDG